MTPLGFSGGSHDRLRVSEVERIRWTVGTAEGAAERFTLYFEALESYFIYEFGDCHFKL